jgi:hypothetical protein
MLVHFVAHRAYPPEVVMAEWDQLIALREEYMKHGREVKRVDMTRDERAWLCRDTVWMPAYDTPTILGFPVRIVEEFANAC